MKILKTFGPDALPPQMRQSSQLEQRGALNTAKVDAVVRDILAAVQAKAMRPYASLPSQ
jgi:histidinol dehydrogenase